MPLLKEKNYHHYHICCSDGNNAEDVRAITVLSLCHPGVTMAQHEKDPSSQGLKKTDCCGITTDVFIYKLVKMMEITSELARST